ncbi:hypothetical protein ACFFUT_09175 [Pseudohalocynthiibacter aestuariivivens]|uniref:Uncharacterized protein n=1 Tax=Pseudohalocynthiibacter aestuariivivens TaxID=1591409 RepID=A0ABV5JEU5_9RHOB|nr:hypothetical protein [Pseudohalocynthiibacter aestuariivivens]MBS9718504.1 hypothetical protein [Pseudohalocynthiibacter aestuariivivens]
MSDNLPIEVRPEDSDLESGSEPRIPRYSRDVNPTNLVLSSNDLKEFCELMIEFNEGAKKLEFDRIDKTQFASEQEAWDRICDLLPIEYNYFAANGDSVTGIGLPDVDGRAFPEELTSFFVSNSAYARRAVNESPLNQVEAFIAFDKPPLKLDLLTLPSNPTENRSVININGTDEAWVIATTEKINEFFRTRAVTRPVIHGSGSYDSFTFLAFLPVLLWVYFHFGSLLVDGWLEKQSIFLNVIIAIYALLVSLIAGRFVFQYIRWLFPPMEYYKKSRTGAFIHRSIASVVLGGAFLSAFYDIGKYVLGAIFK